jgi:hypothetical protein
MSRECLIKEEENDTLTFVLGYVLNQGCHLEYMLLFAHWFYNSGVSEQSVLSSNPGCATK